MPKYALLSVYDKAGLVEFAKVLTETGYEIISTGGTAQTLRLAGIASIDISELTGFPEMMDGRVKTLHPKVHGGLLHLRDNPSHLAQAADHGISAIDLLAVNLYPFEQVTLKPDVSLAVAIENIDIGGPAMLRSAAKNYRSVTVITNPDDYDGVAKELRERGETTIETREKLAAKVFETTSFYDSLIAKFLRELSPAVDMRTPEAATQLFPETLTIPMRRAQLLRYGENPHQNAALYGDFQHHYQQIHGKLLSYNNIVDIDAAVNLIREFPVEPTVCILKHTNPCGVGSGSNLLEAWDNALATDRNAPFGGIIVVNRALDLPIAQAISEIFSEVIIAPSFDPDAQALLSQKKNLRLMLNKSSDVTSRFSFRSATGNAFLVQIPDVEPIDMQRWKVVTQRQPTDAELNAMLFGWRVVKRVKSNAIVFSGADRTLGIGAGQMSRVDSCRLAVMKANDAQLSLQGSIVASDAFFPFADGLIAAAEAGATAAIQPGGSMRDSEVINAANERNMAMVFTSLRHFSH